MDNLSQNQEFYENILYEISRFKAIFTVLNIAQFLILFFIDIYTNLFKVLLLNIIEVNNKNQLKKYKRKAREKV